MPSCQCWFTHKWLLSLVQTELAVTLEQADSIFLHKHTSRWLCVHVQLKVQLIVAVMLCLHCSPCWSDFLRKVYTLLSLQIILTTATSALFMFSQTIKEFVHARWEWSDYHLTKTQATRCQDEKWQPHDRLYMESLGIMNVSFINLSFCVHNTLCKSEWSYWFLESDLSLIQISHWGDHSMCLEIFYRSLMVTMTTNNSTHYLLNSNWNAMSKCKHIHVNGSFHFQWHQTVHIFSDCEMS